MRLQSSDYSVKVLSNRRVHVGKLRPRKEEVAIATSDTNASGDDSDSKPVNGKKSKAEKDRKVAEIKRVATSQSTQLKR